MEFIKVEGLSGYITVLAAAEKLGITVSGVHRMIERRHLHTIRLGNSVLLKASDVSLAKLDRR